MSKMPEMSGTLRELPTVSTKGTKNYPGKSHWVSQTREGRTLCSLPIKKTWEDGKQAGGKVYLNPSEKVSGWTAQLDGDMIVVESKITCSQCKKVIIFAFIHEVEMQLHEEEMQ